MAALEGFIEREGLVSSYIALARPYNASVEVVLQVQPTIGNREAAAFAACVHALQSPLERYCGASAAVRQDGGFAEVRLLTSASPEAVAEQLAVRYAPEHARAAQILARLTTETIAMLRER